VLVVTRLDRLARSMLDLQNIIKTLRDKGAWLRSAFTRPTAKSKSTTAYRRVS
jgi:DNA invertase Pin-like site-specific DNA recombinase